MIILLRFVCGSVFSFLCVGFLRTKSNIHKQVWDYQTKSCVQTLEGHTHNVSAVCFHPELPIIITGSEDGTVRIWHSTTYRLVCSTRWLNIWVRLGVLCFLFHWESKLTYFTPLFDFREFIPSFRGYSSSRNWISTLNLSTQEFRVTLSKLY